MAAARALGLGFAGLTAAAVAVRVDVAREHAAFALVLGLGLGLLWGVVLPMRAAWRAARDPLRQARLVESHSAGSQGRVVSAAAWLAKPPAAVSQVLAGLLVQRASEAAAKVDVEVVHPPQPARRASGLAALALVVGLVSLVSLPGGTQGLLRWWAGGAAGSMVGSMLGGTSGDASARVGDLTLRYIYPAYTGREPHEVVNGTGTVQAPPGTTVQVSARAAKPVSSATLVAYDDPALDASVEEERQIRGSFMVRADEGEWRIVTVDGGGERSSRSFPIQPEPDLAPEVVLDVAGDVLEVAVDKPLNIGWTARDDYGVASVTLMLDGKPYTPSLRQLRDRRTEVSDQLRKRPVELGMVQGGSYELAIAATDNDTVSGAKTGLSRTIRVVVLGEDGRSALTAEREEKLLDLLLNTLADFLEEDWPSGTSHASLARWGQTVAERSEPLASYLDQHRNSRGLLGRAWKPAELSMETLRELVRFTQVAFTPGKAEVVAASTREQLDELRDDVIVVLEISALTFDYRIRGRALFELQKAADQAALESLRAKDLTESGAPAGVVAGELDQVEVALTVVKEAASRLNSGGLRDFAENAVGLVERMMPLARERLAEGGVEAASLQVRRIHVELEGLAAGIRDEIERMVEEGEQRRSQLDELIEELKAVRDAEIELAARSQQLREQSSATTVEADAAAWERAERLASELEAALKQHATNLADADRSVNEQELVRSAAREARNTEASITSRDVSAAAQRASDIGRLWSIYRMRAASQPGVAVARSSDAVLRKLQEVGDAIDALRRQDARPSPEVAKASRDQVGEQQGLRQRFVDAAEDARRLVREFPIPPAGLEGTIEQATVRMDQASTELLRAELLQAEGSLRAAAGHIDDIIDALQQAMQSSQQLEQDMTGAGESSEEGEGGGEEGDEEGDPRDGEGEDGAGSSGNDPQNNPMSLPEPEEFRTPEEYRRALLRGMEGEVPEEYRQLKRRYYEELVLR